MHRDVDDADGIVGERLVEEVARESVPFGHQVFVVAPAEKQFAGLEALGGGGLLAASATISAGFDAGPTGGADTLTRSAIVSESMKWLCGSMKPGIIVLPARSLTRVSSAFCFIASATEPATRSCRLDDDGFDIGRLVTLHGEDRAAMDDEVGTRSLPRTGCHLRGPGGSATRGSRRVGGLLVATHREHGQRRDRANAEYSVEGHGIRTVIPCESCRHGEYRRIASQHKDPFKSRQSLSAWDFALAIGPVPAPIFAQAFGLTPEGLKLESSAERSESTMETCSKSHAKHTRARRSARFRGSTRFSRGFDSNHPLQIPRLARARRSSDSPRRGADSSDQLQPRIQPSPCGEADEQVEAEGTDLAALDVGDPCLGDRKGLCRLGLRHAGTGQPTSKTLEKERAHLHLRGLIVGIEIPKYAAHFLLAMGCSPGNSGESLSRQLDVLKGGLRRLLTEAMQDVDRFRPRREVDRTKCSGWIAHPDLPDTSPDRCHRLPVVRIESALHPEELVDHVVHRRSREGLEVGI